MNDYKETIAKCDYWINLGDEIDKKLAVTKFMEECRDAIEQLVADYEILAKMYAKVNEDLCVRTKERDAAVADLAVFSDCTQCKYRYGSSVCEDCNIDYDKWEWRGVQENNDEAN